MPEPFRAFYRLNYKGISPACHTPPSTARRCFPEFPEKASVGNTGDFTVRLDLAAAKSIIDLAERAAAESHPHNVMVLKGIISRIDCETGTDEPA